MNDNTFKNDFLNLASKLDAVTNSCGEIVKVATVIAEEQDHDSTIYLIRKISKLKESDDVQEEIKSLATALKDSLMKFFGYYYIMSVNEKTVEQKKDTRTLSEILSELDNLIGSMLPMQGAQV